jgi:hypothetical protein
MKPGRRATTVLCLAAAILCASAASARTERFRWTLSSTTVDSFKIYVGGTSGSYTSSVSVGIPAKDSTGAYYYDLGVADTGTVFVTVTAFSGGLESPKSNEISRAGTTSGGGTTTPPPPTGSQPNAPVVTASGWIVHVVPATSGTAATGGWIKLYPFNAQNGALTFTDPISGGGFPRDLDLTSYFSERIDAARIEAEACSENAYGYTCAPRVNVLRSAAPGPAPGQLGAPGQPYIVQ